MSDKHTPGPWHTGGKDGRIVYAADGFAVADATVFHGRHRAKDAAPTETQNARRIVACVNACEGVPTAYLEKNGLPSVDEYLTEEKQRDELLKAILELLEAQKQESKERGGPWVFRGISRETQRRVYEAHQALHAAIANTTGKQS